MNTEPRRRDLFRAAAAVGLVGTEAAAAPAETGITAEMVRDAEWVAGVGLTADDRQRVATTLTAQRAVGDAARKASIPYTVPHALQFRVGADAAPVPVVPARLPVLDPKFPADREAVAYAPLTFLAYWLRANKISSVELTKLYLSRLQQYDAALKFAVALTPELALKQAAAADAELAAGKIRGPLHGIPWGAKDLIAVPGYKTTWGAAHFKDQQFDYAATIYTKLTDAGAVLCAKLTLGALAMGDEWFGGMTRNPWHSAEGSSGSSAGSASAVAAGCLPFAVGSETLGSIVSPCTRCGITGLRPTFGRVSRAGCMGLAFSMDKLGPIARNAEDAAIVFSAMHGADAKDPAAQSRPFAWPATLGTVRVGYAEGRGAEAVKVLNSLGFETVPVKLPTRPAQALIPILDAECAEAFDEITRQGVRDGIGKAWPNTFRSGRFVTAVDYLRLNRLRAQLTAETNAAFETIDAYIGGDDLVLTNFTGHPTVVLPNGTTTRRGAKVPTSITFTGRHWDEARLLAMAAKYQDATDHHRVRPDPANWKG
jgi:Asp-tRNA(Asn)/Glu-tRNA(Gln) amidotransferase A subunit family amidase